MCKLSPRDVIITHELLNSRETSCLSPKQHGAVETLLLFLSPNELFLYDRNCAHKRRSVFVRAWEEHLKIMLRNTGFFRGIDCPFYTEHSESKGSKNGCNRPYCHFRHSQQRRASYGASADVKKQRDLQATQKGVTNVLSNTQMNTAASSLTESVVRTFSGPH